MSRFSRRRRFLAGAAAAAAAVVLAGMAGALLTGCHGGKFDEIEASVTMFNRSSGPIHLFVEGEGFSPDNRVQSGAFIVKDVPVIAEQPGSNITVHAGINQQVLASHTFVGVFAGESRNIAWNGSALVVE